MTSYKRCVEAKKIVPFNVGLEMVKKELKVGKEDLKTSQASLKNKNYKWAIIQGYYAFFHAARALLFLQKKREKGHRCLGAALKALYIEKGFVSPEYYDKFQVAMELREAADYRGAYAKRDAERVVSNAEGMIVVAEQIIQEKGKEDESNGLKREKNKNS